MSTFEEINLSRTGSRFTSFTIRLKIATVQHTSHTSAELSQVFFQNIVHLLTVTEFNMYYCFGPQSMGRILPSGLSKH